MNTILPEAIELLKLKEGFKEVTGPGRLKSYLCPSKVWTIGRGSTYLHGKPVDKTTTCTFAEAEAQFLKDIEAAATTVRRFV